MGWFESFAMALGVLVAFFCVCALWVILAFFIDTQVLSWLGLPTWQGHGIWILGILTVLVMLTVSIHTTS